MGQAAACPGARALRRLLEKCLARMISLPRLRSIADALFDLDEASGPAAEAAVPKRGKRVWAAAGAGVGLGGAIAFVTVAAE